MDPPHPYPPPSPMTAEQKALIEAENKARHLFATDPTSSELSDPHLLLMNVFNSPPQSFAYAEETPEEKRVPKLLTQSRQLDLKGSAIVDKTTFLKNWAEFTQGCLDGLDFTNVFVAGGAVLGCLSSNQDGYRSSDIDLFLYGISSEEEASQKVRSIYRQIVSNTKGKGDVIRTARALTILCQYPFRHIQIILRLYRSPAEVLLGFDIDSCCVGFDGTDVWCQERFKRALTKRYNLINTSRRSLTYESRLFKYSKRGFCIAVPDLDKARINTELFHKDIRDVSGLSRLVLYDYKQGSGKSTFSRFPKSKKSGDPVEGSDYNNDLPIPWGPEWQTDVIINLLHAKNKANFFSSLRKNKGQEPADKSQDANYNHLFTSDAANLANGFNQWKRSIDGQPVDKPLEWIKDNPAYQDFDNGFQRLMTGSFQPVVDQNWETGAYLPNGARIPDHVLATKPFSTNESSIKDSNTHSPSRHVGGGLPFQPVASPKPIKKSVYPKAPKPHPKAHAQPAVQSSPVKKSLKTPKASGGTSTGFGGTSTGFGGTSTGFGGTSTGFGGTTAGFGGTNAGFGTTAGFGGIGSTTTPSFGSGFQAVPTPTTAPSAGSGFFPAAHPPPTGGWGIAPSSPSAYAPLPASPAPVQQEAFFFRAKSLPGSYGFSSRTATHRSGLLLRTRADFL